MATSDPRARLQPALLDRLRDDQPGAPRDPEDHRGVDKAQLRAAVLRDLTWLLNTVQPLRAAEAAAAPLAARSTLNYGLPPLSGQLATQVDLGELAQALREAIVRYEPRVLPQTLSVRARQDQFLLDTHNVIEFDIRGHLWAQPIPLELLLRTAFDLEAGQVQLRDAAPAPLNPGRR